MTKDPRTPEMIERYNEMLAKQRRDKFWEAVEQRQSPERARSAATIVENLLRATKRRWKR